MYIRFSLRASVITLLMAFVLAGCASAPPLLQISVSQSATALNSSTQAKIQNAMSAGPAAIAKDATILDYPSNGQSDFVVLRQGTNGWTCFPDTPGTPTDDPLCGDQRWVDWIKANMGGPTGPAPHFADPGIGYMLRGGSDASNTDPFATQPPPGADWIIEPPHVMMIVPSTLDPKVLSTDPKSGGPWIMFAGTPYEHLMVPVVKEPNGQAR